MGRRGRNGSMLSADPPLASPEAIAEIRKHPAVWLRGRKQRR
jgi:hypothetical protein